MTIMIKERRAYVRTGAYMYKYNTLYGKNNERQTDGEKELKRKRERERVRVNERANE